MTENYDDEEVLSRTLEGVEAFISKFQRLRIKKEAQSMPVKNPFDGTRTNVTSLIAYLVSHYERFSSATKKAKRDFQTDPIQFGQLYQEAIMKRDKAAMCLSQMITFAYAYGLIDEGEGLENKLDELKKNNAELEARIFQLSSDLKKCREDSEAYKRTVTPLGNKKNPEYGAVAV